MTLSLIALEAGNVTALAAQITAALASQLSKAVVGVNFSALDPFLGTHCRVVLALEDSATTLGAPYVCSGYASGSLGDVAAMIAAQIAASPSDFYSPPLIISMTSNRSPSQHLGLIFSSTDAVNAPANWSPAPLTGALLAANNLSDVVDPNLARVNLNQGHVTVVDGPTPTINFGLSNALEWTLGASRNAPAPTGMKAGGTYLLQLTQGGAGTNLVTWDAAWVWPGGVAPTLQTAVGAVDIITGYYDGTTFRVSAGAGWLS